MRIWLAQSQHLGYFILCGSGKFIILFPLKTKQVKLGFYIYQKLQ